MQLFILNHFSVNVAVDGHESENNCKKKKCFLQSKLSCKELWEAILESPDKGPITVVFSEP